MRCSALPRPCASGQREESDGAATGVLLLLPRCAALSRAAVARARGVFVPAWLAAAGSAVRPRACVRYPAPTPRPPRRAPSPLPPRRRAAPPTRAGTPDRGSDFPYRASAAHSARGRDVGRAFFPRAPLLFSAASSSESGATLRAGASSGLSFFLIFRAFSTFYSTRRSSFVCERHVFVEFFLWMTLSVPVINVRCPWGGKL